MKIAILTPTFSYYSGIDRVAQQQAESFSRKRHKVTVFALEAKIRAKGYKVIELGMPKNPMLQRLYRLFFFLDLKAMKNYQKLKDFDLVISHFYPMNWLAYMAKKKYNIRYEYYNHGINAGDMGIFGWIYMLFFSILDHFTVRHVDRAYSVSRFLKEEMKKHYGIVSEVKYNTIDRRFNIKVKGNKIIKKYKLKSKKILLYIGRISPHKGIHLLLKAFGMIRKERKDVKLIIAGKPTFENYFKKLKKMANKDVIFTGYFDDKLLPAFYGACDLYVTCSLWEGFNLPAAEAQACGKKVIAFNIGSHPEVVKNGYLVKKGSIKGFAKAVLKALK